MLAAIRRLEGALRISSVEGWDLGPYWRSPSIRYGKKLVTRIIPNIGITALVFFFEAESAQIYAMQYGCLPRRTSRDLSHLKSPGTSPSKRGQ
jgi:hypothetical protein